MKVRRAAGAVGAAVGMALLLAGMGCGPPRVAIPEGGLLVTQVPVGARAGEGVMDILDMRYPAGSRVVFIPRPEVAGGRDLRILSDGLLAAGAPVVGPDGREVLFVGKAGPGAAWQVYRARLGGSGCRPVTRVVGGAMAPAWLPGDRCVFVSPVPRAGEPGGSGGVPVPALYSLSVTGGIPARLTHGWVPATDPTVLSDGRILFVSAVAGASERGTSLFTINNDGTEVSAFAGQHDGSALIHRPRESPDGRVLFLSGAGGGAAMEGRMEQVQTARPFRSRSVVFPQLTLPCRAVEPDGAGRVLATLREPGPDPLRTSFAVHRLGADVPLPGVVVYDDPAWHEVEALRPGQAVRPMGRLSSLEPERREGVVLCLDSRISDRPWPGGGGEPGDGFPGVRVRWIRGTADGGAEVLGQTPVLADGSFMVRVPADTPLGVELLDGAGNVVRRCPPFFWVRPGENRSCVGCHEPHNRAPENGRPLAVRQAPAVLASGVGGGGVGGRRGVP